MVWLNDGCVPRGVSRPLGLAISRLLLWLPDKPESRYRSCRFGVHPGISDEMTPPRMGELATRGVLMSLVTYNFLEDMALVLCVAALATVICQVLRQPLLLGYLIAGMVVPYQGAIGARGDRFEPSGELQLTFAN